MRPEAAGQRASSSDAFVQRCHDAIEGVRFTHDTHGRAPARGNAKARRRRIGPGVCSALVRATAVITGIAVQSWVAKEVFPSLWIRLRGTEAGRDHAAGSRSAGAPTV